MACRVKQSSVSRWCWGFVIGMLPPALLFAADGVRSSAEGDAILSIGKAHRYADVLLDSDRFTGNYTVTPNVGDIGKTGSLYLAAKVEGRWFAHDGKKWREWSGHQSELPSFATRTLAATEQLAFARDQLLQAGSYTVFAGYQVAGGALVYNPKPLQFVVAAKGEASLVPFSSDTSMEAYLKQGMENGAGRNNLLVRTLDVATAATAGSVASTTSTTARTSTTNLQELGVDEADVVKTEGDNLFMLAKCKEGPCLQAHAMDSSNARTTLLGNITLGSKSTPQGMYLVERGILGQKMMVTLSWQNANYTWRTMWGWGESKTELEFINLSAPKVMSSIEKLSLDGTLIASRRVGDFLYLVTRYTPNLPGFVVNPYLKSQEASNTNVVAAASLPVLLPRIEDSRKKTEELIKSKSCYLSTSAVDDNSNPSIITITVVPLASPINHSSTCFLGESETLYMTPSSLYLATTNFQYNTLAVDKSFAYAPNHSTNIHKFALSAGKVEYRGSGVVQGHLGWEEDKKSFRLGENKGYLNVATSIGETWAGNSSTRLTVLRDADSNKKMLPVNVIDNIGLKNEKLYATRFLGDRAYLVTFRVTDPLYVIDLGNQEQPKIAGELKINGYSDYLHPVSETLLLGIGKDAVPDVRSTDDNGRGAWYQGVKLSLFDVSNIAAPKEVNAVILGKRGTSTDVSWDHHALSFLPALGSEPARLALPVQLHDTVPDWKGWSASEPSAWYSHTHTALYEFEISKFGISKAGRLISELPQPSTTASKAAASGVAILPVNPGFAPESVYYGDRSVLKDDAVFYLHSGKILSAKWGESK